VQSARFSLEEAQHRWADADPEAEEVSALERTRRLAQATG
jgi:hypothetical protein